MKKGIQFYLDYDNWKRFKIKCIEEDKQPSKIIDEFLISFCKAEERKDKYTLSYDDLDNGIIK